MYVEIDEETGKVYIKLTSYPTKPDSDEDGLSDGEEYYLSIKPLRRDSDDDRISDFYEEYFGFDPLNANPDGDSFSDYEELQNRTSPFSYNLSFDESAVAFWNGAILGDWTIADNIETLLGQMSFSFIPYVADFRDYIANVFFNLNTGSALISWSGFIADLSGVFGVVTDAGKALSKVCAFIVKHIDDVPKVFDAISQSSKLFKNNDEFISMLAAMLPIGAIDNIADSIKNGSKITKADYETAQKLCKAAGKSLDEAVAIGKKTVQDVLSNKTLTNSTGKVDNYVSATKGFDVAKVDFDSLPLINVDSVPRDNGTIVGYLSDGRIVNVRPYSSKDYPTLEIFDKNTGRSIKIRY